jgi:hypothetical protein
MLNIAERHELNDFARKAERALENMAAVTSPVTRIKRRERKEEPTQLSAVADSLSKMRVLAGL